MLINCSHCSARINGEVQRLFPVYDHEEDGSVISGYRVSLMKCPACSGAVVGREELVHYREDSFGDDIQWGPAKRVWPDPESGLDSSIPNAVRISLDEARGCLAARYYTSSVVMSGRALEAVARHFHMGEKAQRLMLAQGLKELHDTGKIDDRLHEWGKELHEHRNLAAHANDTVFKREDAEDLYDFVTAICDYLFVLQDRYERFIQRKNAKQAMTA